MVAKRSALDWFLSIGIWLLFVILLVPAIALGFVVGRSEKQDTKTVVQTPAMAAKSLIKSAPAFSTDDLWQTASDDWITNGGSTSNQRYSSLDEINDSNVQNLRGVWLTHLRKSGLAAKYSAESQPLEYQGVIYVPTGQDDVFAVSADTGEILWEYKAHLDQTISVVCCGWESRGVALGEGKVYIGQLDGSLVALDQKTGQVAWKTQVARWQDGYSVTAAPLYVNGMVVTGVSGGEFGTRGSVTAYDATTGKQKWRFYTIPGPGQTGHDTWPQSNDAWKAGGAPVWQTPSVDPELGTLYFTTGNAGPDNNGSSRAGKNLFTASMVALDVQTGKLKWWYQMVHHDIWDYDAPSPTILFDAKVERQGREGDRRGREDRLGLSAEPRDREAAVPDAGEEGAAGGQPEDVADAAVPAVRAGRPARGLRRAVPGGAEGVDDALEGRPGEGDPRHGDVHALLEDDDGLHAGAAGRHELAAVELQPEHAPLLRLRAERCHRQHRNAEHRARSRVTSRRSRSAAR